MRLTAMPALLLTVAGVLCVTACMNPGPPISPLIAAAREGDAARLSELIASGADVNQRGGVNDWTPLMHAVHKNQIASVRALIEAGADINAEAGARGGDTALRLAMVQGHPDIAAVLREHGAKPPQ
jgi:uncharacterized protein